MRVSASRFLSYPLLSSFHCPGPPVWGWARKWKRRAQGAEFCVCAHRRFSLRDIGSLWILAISNYAHKTTPHRPPLTLTRDHMLQSRPPTPQSSLSTNPFSFIAFPRGSL